MKFWQPLLVTLALLHSTYSLTAVSWALQWCGPNYALFIYSTDTYFTSPVFQWNPQAPPGPIEWHLLSICSQPDEPKPGYLSINFQPKSTKTGETTVAINTYGSTNSNWQMDSCAWKNIGKTAMNGAKCSAGWSSCSGGYLTDQQLPNNGPNC